MSYIDAAKVEQHLAEVIPLSPRGPVAADEAPAAEGETITAPPIARSPREVPEHLLDVPGLVGHIMRWITKSALYPQPLLALGAALSVVGTAAGRKYAGPTKSGTHLYILGLAETGAGKNHAAKLGKRLLRASSMDDLIGPGQFMSEPAVYQYVAKQPQMLCFMDEFGSYLQRINNPKGASGYEKAISGALRSFWGASFDTINPPGWAQSSSRDALKPIHSPALSIYGMSVHDEFYQALQSADVANGFLNRFLILSTHAVPDEVDPELDEDEVPKQLVSWLQHIGATTARQAQSAAGGGWAAEIRLDWSCADARLKYRGFRSEMQADGKDRRLLSRVPEMAVRLATVRAIGRAKGPTVPMVDLEDITWGCELAEWSANRMIADAADYMVESDHQARVKEVLRLIREAPGGRMTKTDLTRKLKHKFDNRTINIALESLAEADEIEITRVKAEGLGRPTDWLKVKG